MKQNSPVQTKGESSRLISVAASYRKFLTHNKLEFEVSGEILKQLTYLLSK